MLIAPPHRITSLLTPTVERGELASAAHSTPVAVRLVVLLSANRTRVTVALGRMAKLGRGGSGSI